MPFHYSSYHTHVVKQKSTSFITFFKVAQHITFPQNFSSHLTKLHSLDQQNKDKQTFNKAKK